MLPPASIGYELEPAERRFRDAYIKDVRAALDEKKYAAALSQGREMRLAEAVASARRQPSEKDGESQNANGKIADIIIENHSFSRIFIEDESEETPEDWQDSPVIEINAGNKFVEK